jgi:hypothetical protein
MAYGGAAAKLHTFLITTQGAEWSSLYLRKESHIIHKVYH